MNGMVAIAGIVAAVLVFNIAGDVGKERAKAMVECYKAAQANTNIKCVAEQP